MNATLRDIWDECVSYGEQSPEYVQKQIHKVPPTDVVDRVRSIVPRCAGKRVLSLGCTGYLQEAIDAVAQRSYGIDRDAQGREWFFQMDLDDFDEFPKFDVDLVVCGEVLEHLANPGRVLKALREYERPVVITVPNAHASGSYQSLRRGVENVNRDHVAYYSYWTLHELVARYGFEITEWHWYNGVPLFAEGLIFWVK
jgi:hypothetical protein